MNLIEAATLALNGMRRVTEAGIFEGELDEAITALRAALAEPEHRPDCALLKIPSRDCDCAKPDQDKFCDTHCTWRDHHPDCVRAEPEQEPVCAHGVKKIKCGFCQQIGKGFAPTPQPEPIGTVKELFTQSAWERLDLKGSTKVYTAPIPRKPLTDGDIVEIAVATQGMSDFDFARAIEAAHGIKAFRALRAALAETEQEPVAWIEHGLVEAHDGLVWVRGSVGKYTPLYTAPTPRKPEQECDKDPRGCWSVRCQLGKKCKNAPTPRKPLTDEEIESICRSFRLGYTDQDLARAIEAAHGIKEQEHE